MAPYACHTRPVLALVIAMAAAIALLTLSISWGGAINGPLATILSHDSRDGATFEIQRPTLRLVRAE